MAKPDTSLQEYEEWEELGDDNGELIDFSIGTTETGVFIRRATVELPEERQQNGQTHADLLVFHHTDNPDNRWSVWVKYQLDRIPWEEGATYKVSCTGERKAAQGSVKIFSVKKRHVKREEAF